MFKKTFVLPPLLAAALSALLGGCVTGPPLAQTNLSEPGWSLQQGQAVWRSKKGAADVAGELLVATNSANRVVIQFTKTPFPLVIARTEGNSWQIESPAQDRRFSGRGSPPPRILWFHLPRALAGAPLPSPWHWRRSDGNWTLENRSTGELLEGYLDNSPR